MVMPFPGGQATYIPKQGAINVEAVYAAIDEINSAMLALLQRALAAVQDIDAKIDDEARARELILAPQPMEWPELNPDGTLKLDEAGVPINQGKPAGRLEPITDEQYKALNLRLDLLKTLVKMINEPVGNATKSYAQRVRANARLFTVY